MLAISRWLRSTSDDTTGMQERNYRNPERVAARLRTLRVRRAIGALFSGGVASLNRRLIA